MGEPNAFTYLTIFLFCDLHKILYYESNLSDYCELRAIHRSHIKKKTSLQIYLFIYFWRVGVNT